VNAEPDRTDTADPRSDRDPVEALATEFVEGLRLGERPSVDEYAAAHPELAADIRELFPTIASMEGLKLSQQQATGGPVSLGTVDLKRLGDFRILREIGRGGMGIVFEAEQESLGRRVAVKVLPKSALLDAKHLQRFQREAQTAAALHHTNIVPVFGVGRQDDFHYYAMQYIEGAGLDCVLQRLQSRAESAERGDFGHIARKILETGGAAGETGTAVPQCDAQTTASLRRQATQAAAAPPDAPDDELPVIVVQTDSKDVSYWSGVARLGVQVADALEYAHGKGVLHRDIKPGNLIVDTEGAAWVADFGLAKALEHPRVSTTGDVLGTPAYMAPEQLRGQSDCRSDVYGLGMTLYELLTLRSAHRGADRARMLNQIAAEGLPRPRRIRPEIPRDLETIVLKAIAREPGRRYGSARELASDLERFLEDRPIRARRATPLERLWRACRRNPVVAGLTATAVALLMAVAVIGSVGYAQTSRALDGERQQRRRAEVATDLALEVLDKVYERFAPPRSGSSLFDEDGNYVPKPALSDGAAGVLEDMLVFYDRLAEQGMDGAEYRERIALANRRVGDIRHHLGQADQATASYRRSLGLYRQLNESSDDRAYVAQIASIHNELGLLAHWSMSPGEAREFHAEALKMLEEATEVGIQRDDVRQELARTRELVSWQERIRHVPPVPPGPPGRHGHHPGQQPDHEPPPPGFDGPPVPPHPPRHPPGGPM